MTIYNYWYNPETKENEYRKTKIQGIHWYTDQKVSVTDRGIVSANMYKIRIPKDAVIQNEREYIDSKQYHLLDVGIVDRYWTVDMGDLFVKGLVDFEAASLSSLKQFPEAGKIISYSINLFGMSPHIRIGGAG